MGLVPGSGCVDDQESLQSSVEALCRLPPNTSPQQQLWTRDEPITRGRGCPESGAFGSGAAGGLRPIAAGPAGSNPSLTFPREFCSITQRSGTAWTTSIGPELASCSRWVPPGLVTQILLRRLEAIGPSVDIHHPPTLCWSCATGTVRRVASLLCHGDPRKQIAEAQIRFLIPLPSGIRTAMPNLSNGMRSNVCGNANLKALWRAQFRMTLTARRCFD